MIVLFAGTLMVLLSAAWIDVRKGRIPNILVFSLLLFETVIFVFGKRLFNAPVFTGPELYERIKAFVLTIVCLYPFFAIGELGAGDIKLLSVTVLSVINPLKFILIAFILGGALGIGKTVLQKKDLRTVRVSVQMALPILFAFIFSEWTFITEVFRFG